MKNNRMRFRLALICLATLSIVVGQAAEARCLTPSESQNLANSGAIQRLGAIARAVGGQITNVRLCESNGLLVYQLAVERDGGRIDNVVVDATSGQPLR